MEAGCRILSRWLLSLAVAARALSIFSPWGWMCSLGGSRGPSLRDVEAAPPQAPLLGLPLYVLKVTANLKFYSEFIF